MHPVLHAALVGYGFVPSCMVFPVSAVMLKRPVEYDASLEAFSKPIVQLADDELAEELSFLANCDRTKRAMQEVVDLPDRDLDRFIRLCLQNNGTLSPATTPNRASLVCRECFAPTRGLWPSRPRVAVNPRATGPRSIPC